MSQWDQYYAGVGERPNPLVVSVLESYVSGRSAALDLGAGNLRNAKFLKNAGFRRVVAVDHSEETRAFSTEGIELLIQSIQAYKPESQTFDFVISYSTLFFLPEALVRQVFENVLPGLCSGGVFACNVLGPEDDWVMADASVSAFQESDIAQLCAGFEVLDVSSVHFDQPLVASVQHQPPKHWHQWRLVLKKP